MHPIKKTKIVATIGPATAQDAVMPKLMEAGMNVARLNFSHGDFVEHQRSVDMIRKYSAELGKHIGILQDLSGPKIRIGEFYQERVILTPGDDFILTTEPCTGDEHKAFINYAELPKEVKPGEPILLDDGKKKMEVVRVEGNEIYCKILVGGETKGKRGVNLPGTDIRMSCLTPKDLKDLEFGVKNKVDFMALSFVRKESDVHELRAILKEKGCRARIIVKLETPQAIEHLEVILQAADGAMVARGDLAVEVPMEQVPVLQKRIVKRCRQLGKPVIVATQMLESMIHSPVATRAEVSDVANAILDGTDAVMLSEETTLGEYPVEAVATMTRIALHTEAHYPHRHILKSKHTLPENVVVDSITNALANTAEEVGASVIVALTESGFTARMISRHRPGQHIIVLTPNQETLTRMALSFGCYAYTAGGFENVSLVIDEARRILIASGFVQKGERFVLAAGLPFGETGGTNLLMVETV